MRRAGSGLTDPDTIKDRLENYARVAQLALKWNGSPVHWRGINRTIAGYCTYSKEPLPDWKGCGFTQLKPFLMHLAGQTRIRFVGDYIVHPENEDDSVDVVGYDDDEQSEEAEEIKRTPLNRSTSSTVVTHAKAISSPKLNKSNSFSKGASSGKLVNCPICQTMIAEDEVNRHLDECLNMQMINNEQQNGANNVAAVPNNNNPRGIAAVAAVATVPQLNIALEDEDEVLHAPRRSNRGLVGLGKRRRSAAKTFTPSKRARVVVPMYEEEEQHYEEEDNEEEEEEEDQLVHNNNNRLRLINEQLRTIQQLQAATLANKQTNHVHLHLSDDSDSEDNANNAQGGGDSRFAEKILDRTLADKECIICYMPMERGQLVATMRCFCQFHKECLLDWFEKREVCPTHSEMSM